MPYGVLILSSPGPGTEPNAPCSGRQSPNWGLPGSPKRAVLKAERPPEGGEEIKSKSVQGVLQRAGGQPGVPWGREGPAALKIGCSLARASHSCNFSSLKLYLEAMEGKENEYDGETRSSWGIMRGEMPVYCGQQRHTGEAAAPTFISAWWSA